MPDGDLVLWHNRNLRNVLRALAIGEPRVERSDIFYERIITDDFFDALLMAEGFGERVGVVVFEPEVRSAIDRLEPMLLRIQNAIYGGKDEVVEEVWSEASLAAARLLGGLGWAGEPDWSQFES